MDRIKRAALLISGSIFALAGLFFCWYCLRLLYVNLFFADAAAHRSSGMYIGAVVFPLAALGFGALSWLCFRKARLSGVSK